MSTACEIKQHFTCDGTGQICTTCGESEAACSCDEEIMNLEACEECAGTGLFCVMHEKESGHG